MDYSKKELMELVMVKTMAELSQRNEDGKVCWMHFGTDGKVKHSITADFRRLKDSFSQDGFHGSILIELSKNGTAMVGWDINLHQNAK